MTHQFNKPPTIEALSEVIFNQVVKFAQQNQVFSINDLTCSIRQNYVCGMNDIKHIFNKLLRDGVFTHILTLSSKFNGVYHEYTPTLNTVVSVTPSQNTTTPTFVKPSRSEIEDRVSHYLVYCMFKSFRPTLKQIQSAIKRKKVSTGWTCKELSDVIENSLGWTVIVENKFSTSTVAV